MEHEPAYIEENFGVLTDDELYIDCVLVKPALATDEDLKVLRVWVPKFPLTKSSVITCARQEVQSYGADGKIAHLVFDLRGTGESEGILGDQSYDQDLYAIQEWAKERFGSINFGFLGFPTINEIANVEVWPLRAGAVMETYRYPAVGGSSNSSTVIYLSTYSNFSQKDEAICLGLADRGFTVYGLDPLRYLLHANMNSRLSSEMLATDIQELIQMLPSLPIIIGQPLAAGLALHWTAEVEQIRGVIAIGQAQSGLSLKHIFDNDNPMTFHLGRHIPKISPRPIAFVIPESRRKKSIEQELQMLYQSAQDPRKIVELKETAPDELVGLLNWLVENEP